MDPSKENRRGKGLLYLAPAATLCLLLATVMSACDSAAGGAPSATAGPSQATSQSVGPTPDSAQANRVCGLANPQVDRTGAAPTPPSNSLTALSGSLAGLQALYVSNNEFYVNTGSQVAAYSPGGHQLWSAALQGGESGEPVVSPSGTLFMVVSSKGVEVTPPSGSKDKPSLISVPNAYGVFPWASGSTFEVLVSLANSSTAEIFSGSGREQGTLSLAGPTGIIQVSTTPAGDELVADDATVQTFSPTGRLLSAFGSAPSLFDSQAPSFTSEGGAVQAGSTIYVVDGSQIDDFSPQGFFRSDTTLNGAFAPIVGSQLYLLGNDQLAFADNSSSGSEVTGLPLSDLSTWLDQPTTPAPVLAYGAAVVMGTPQHPVFGNYFANGTAPVAYAAFDHWWSLQANDLELSYSVASLAEEVDDDWPPPQVVPLAKAAPLYDIDLQLPTAVPGSYQIDAQLLDTSTGKARVVGSSCVTYAVGAPGEQLDFSTLPGSPSYGGPPDTRGVVLNSELGLDGFRGSSFDWEALLPSCSASSPNSTDCGPGAMVMSALPQSYFQAAWLADAHHLRYWVQVSNEAPGKTSYALAQGGWWEADVEKVVAFYSNLSNCQGSQTDHECATVTSWEAWNEPNNTGWSDPTLYVQQVLAPFYQGVKQANPAATVIGGTTLGVDQGWWEGLVAAGGLADLDVAGLHPYTGYDDTWEEYDTISEVRVLRSYLAHACATQAHDPCYRGGLPMWFTEVGWWSDDSFGLYQQANAIARAMVWQAALNIPVWEYYYDEGGWDLPWPLIQGNGPGEYLKPSGLASMETELQLRGRRFLSMPLDSSGNVGASSSPIPQTYEALFSSRRGDGDDLAALWTDGLAVVVRARVEAAGTAPVAVTVTDQYGNTEQLNLVPGQLSRLDLDSAVVWVRFPRQDRLVITGTENYGVDVALSYTGATASATSGTPALAIDGTPAGSNYWQSGVEIHPRITVWLKKRHLVNRVVVVTASIGSTQEGLRNYRVLVRKPSGSWVLVGNVTGEFWEHAEQLDFLPVEANAVRVIVDQVDAGSDLGGTPPWYYGATQPQPAIIRQLEVYGGGSDLAELAGNNLRGPPLTP